MALPEIIEKIKADVQREARAVIDAAQTDAEEKIASAKNEADMERAIKLKDAEFQAKKEAQSISVNGRLEASKYVLSRRRALIESAMLDVTRALAELPPQRYAEFLARHIVEAARGGEELRFGSVDGSIIDSIISKIAAEKTETGSSLSLRINRDESAPFEHGALLLGDRTKVELSLAEIVQSQRRELEPFLDKELFRAQR